MWKPAAVLAGAFALGCLVIASCATRSAAPSTPSGANTAMAAPGEGACKIDAKKMCIAVRDRPVRFAAGGLSGNLTYQNENSLATEWEIWHVQIPKGSRFDVQCEINTDQRRVVYATELSRPALGAQDIAWLSKSGLCTGQRQTISKQDLSAIMTAGEAP